MIGERIKKIRQSVGKTQQELADDLNLKRNTIATYEMGKSEPSDRTIADICRLYNVNETWLRTGEGEMFLDLPPDQELDEIFAQIRVSSDNTIKAIVRAYWRLSDNDKAVIRKVIADIAEEQKNGQG